MRVVVRMFDKRRSERTERVLWRREAEVVHRGEGRRNCVNHYLRVSRLEIGRGEKKLTAKSPAEREIL